MGFINILHAIVLGIVQGFTEFLPISSTGHLIILSNLLGRYNEKTGIFDVVVQFGAILAVCWEFRPEIFKIFKSFIYYNRSGQLLALNIIITCIPTCILGLLFSRQIKLFLFSPIPVAIALVIGGIVILIIEKRNRHLIEISENNVERDTVLYRRCINSVEDLTVSDAIKIGIAQCFALIPGTSRSASTVIGGLLFGLDRRIATEFSFLVAIPIIFAATIHDLYQARNIFDINDINGLILGLLATFFSAIICIRWLIRFISTHDFTGFAWYRIIFGGFILISSCAGWIKWQ